VRRETDSALIDYMVRDQHLMMNFWIPGFHDWNVGFEATGMPWYARYDFVEVWDYVPPEEWANYDVAS
jgi:hypothetical protein